MLLRTNFDEEIKKLFEDEEFYKRMREFEALHPSSPSDK